MLEQAVYAKEEREKRAAAAAHWLVVIVIAYIFLCIVGSLSAAWVCGSSEERCEQVPLVVLGLVSTAVSGFTVVSTGGLYAIYYMVYCRLAMRQRRALDGCEARLKEKYELTEVRTISTAEYEKITKMAPRVGRMYALYDIVGRRDKLIAAYVFCTSYVLALAMFMLGWYKTALVLYVGLPVPADLCRLMLFGSAEFDEDREEIDFSF